MKYILSFLMLASFAINVNAAQKDATQKIYLESVDNRTRHDITLSVCPDTKDLDYIQPNDLDFQDIDTITPRCLMINTYDLPTQDVKKYKPHKSGVVSVLKMYAHTNPAHIFTLRFIKANLFQSAGKMSVLLQDCQTPNNYREPWEMLQQSAANYAYVNIIIQSLDIHEIAVHMRNIPSDLAGE